MDEAEHHPLEQYGATRRGQRREESSKNQVIAFLLAFFAGFLGVHRFYVGKFWSGILQFLTFGGFGIWWLLDCFAILMGRFRDADGRRLGTPRTLRGEPAKGERRVEPSEFDNRRRKLDNRPEADVRGDDLLEDPLEREFRQLERELENENQRSEDSET